MTDRRAPLSEALLGWPRLAKQAFVAALDGTMALLATWLAFSLRLDQPHWPEGLQWTLYLLGPGLSIPVFIKLGLYRAIFRYTGLAALLTTVRAIGIYAVLLGLALVPLHAMSEQGMPRSMAILQPLIFLIMVGGSRALARFWLAGLSGKHRHAPHRLLIYGHGEAAVQTATSLSSSPAYLALGFIDETGEQVGRTINGVDVYAAERVPELVDRLGITDILLAQPEASRSERNRILARLEPLPVHVQTLPRLADLASGRVTVQDFRELDIEDLLGRDPVAPDPALLARDLADRTVLVTGAGGSIGSELSRQILLQRPRCLLLLDHAEFGLYEIEADLLALARQHAIDCSVIPLLGNVQNAARFEEIFSTWKPQVVYHAAAYKHVPMVEHNPAEGVRNNVLGSLIVARAARKHGAARCVLISTDKAVRPTNLMGASKRVAELVFQAMANDGTCFSMVRFGNVLGSSGSVVPLFRRQIAAGGPVTVTHEDVTRYFMTIPEAVQLVLQAGAMAQGGEVFVLDMGEPVRILDLAHRMVALAGLSVRDEAHPQGDIEIQVTGLRPGEKLYEELLIGDDPQPTRHPRIWQAREASLPWSELEPLLQRLAAACDCNDVAALQQVLRTLVPDGELPVDRFDHVHRARHAG